MKKIYFLVIIAITMSACQKEPLPELQNKESIPSTTLQKVRFENLPKSVSKYFNEQNKFLIKGMRISNIFGAIETDIPSKKITTMEGEISYTFALKNSEKENKSSASFYFDNLVIFKREKKDYIYFLRYEPDMKWYRKSRNFSSYTGSVTIYNSKGSKINSIIMENGKTKRNGSDNLNGSKSPCTFEFTEEGTICTDGGSIDAEGSLVDWTCTTKYTMRFNCPTGGTGGTSGDSGSPDSSTGGNDGGDTSGSGDDDLDDFEFSDGETAPNPPLEELVPYEVKLDSSFLEIEKIKCTYITLVNQKSLQEILVDFFGEDAVFDLSFNVVDSLNCNGNLNASGCTTPLGDGAYRIDVDKEYINNQNTPTIFLAQTLIHEAIHANLFAAVKKLNSGILPRDTSFAALYNDYRELQNWSHEIMAEHYTSIMEEAIREVHPHLNDTEFINNYNNNTLWNWDDFYEYISYRGLQYTESGAEFYGDANNNISFYQAAAETNSTKIPNCDE